MKRADLDALQLERLRRMVDYCYNNVPFYNERLKAAGITSGDKIKGAFGHPVHTVYDEGRHPRPLPVRHAGAPDERYRAHPRLLGHDGQADRRRVHAERPRQLVGQCGAAVCGGRRDGCGHHQIAFGYGLFTGALGLHYGLEKLGGDGHPASSGNSEKQLMMLRDFGVTGLVATPSYAIYLSEMVREGEYPHFGVQAAASASSAARAARRRCASASSRISASA